MDEFMLMPRQAQQTWNLLGCVAFNQKINCYFLTLLLSDETSALHTDGPRFRSQDLQFKKYQMVRSGKDLHMRP